MAKARKLTGSKCYYTELY